MPQLPTCNDQGIYIVAMYLGIFAKAGIKTTIQTFALGAVATLNAPMARVNLFGQVVNEDLRPYAAVHMAKRNAVIRDTIELQYPLLPSSVNYACKEFWCSEEEGRKRHVHNHLFDPGFKEKDYLVWRDMWKKDQNQYRKSGETDESTEPDAQDQEDNDN
eukprot:CFRG1933T1